MSNVLVISDNPTLVAGMVKLLAQPKFSSHSFDFRCSKGSEEAISKAVGKSVLSIKVKSENPLALAQQLDLILSLHCKQLFPADLVSAVRCVNVHPGLNPYNRGWFPQVFSILNGLPTGATIHEIDEELDHGNIIIQAPVPSYKWDTSIDIYNRVLAKELELLELHLAKIISGEYETTSPSEEGNLNLKKDFNQLCELDLSKTQTVGDTIDSLRALTHGEYQNAYFIDPDSGKKVFVSVNLNVKETDE